MALKRLPWFFVSLMWVSCSAEIVLPSGVGADPFADPDVILDPPILPEEPEPVCDERKAGAPPLRRLSQTEYWNTVRDLFSDPGIPSTDLAVDGSTGLFVNNAGSPVSRVVALRYLEAAETISKREQGRLNTIAPCDVAGLGEEACAKRFIEGFGRRAFRRPLVAAEVTQFLATFKAVRTIQGGYAPAMSVLMQLFLQSPHFLNHLEVGDATRSEGSVVPLTGYEIASRLSYFFWQSMPDDALFTAAQQGTLDTVAGVTAQARRLLASERAKPVVINFYHQLLRLDGLEQVQKEAALFPTFTPELRQAMGDETEAFINHVMWTEDARLKTLLTAPFSYLNPELAALYGVTLPGNGGGIPGRGGTEDLAVATTSARYVRVHGTERGTPYGYSLWELEVYDAAGANVALGKTASASSQYVGFPPNFVNDGATNTRWASQNTNDNQITVDLGGNHSVNRVVLKWEAAYAKAYQVLVSTDGSTWTAIYSTGANSGFQRVALDPTQRSGLLTQASLLAMKSHPDQTSPVHRGIFVRERLLCQELKAPPPGLVIIIPEVQPGSTTRQRFAEHSTNAYCAGCHQFMDPIGLGFENYDAIGRYRITDGPAPVDANGEIFGADELNGKFEGAVALGARLVESKRVHRCIASEWLSFALQRVIAPDDQCSVVNLGTAFIDSGGDLKELMINVTQSDAFRFRRPIVTETCS